MNQTISVIVPVYNVVRYLNECLESLISQTYQDLEIILIDDGSTDGSGALCDEFSERDSRIKVIHQQNGGAASAKNAGLRAANGQYLSFVDGDDYLVTDAYEFMIGKIKQSNADIVRCGVQYVFRNNVKKEIKHIIKEENTAEEFLVKFTKDWTAGLMVDKLYRRKIFEGIFFEEGHKIDDEFFTYQGIMNANKILSFPRIIYCYRKRKSSVMNSKNAQKQILMDKLDYVSKRRKNVLAKFPRLKSIYDNHYANFMLLLCRDAYVTEKSIIQIKKQIKSFLNEKDMPAISIRMMLLLAKTILTPNPILLKKKNVIVSDAFQEDYFE